jgi:hypothetical protein
MIKVNVLKVRKQQMEDSWENSVYFRNTQKSSFFLFLRNQREKKGRGKREEKIRSLEGIST